MGVAARSPLRTAGEREIKQMAKYELFTMLFFQILCVFEVFHNKKIYRYHGLMGLC